MSFNIHKKHKDRYRIQFCDEKFYLDHQNEFAMWKTLFAPLSNVFKLQAWVVALSILRRPNSWYGGRRAHPFLTDTSASQHPFTLQRLFENTNMKISAKIPHDMNLFDFINQNKIKAIPESCFRSLCFVADKTYPVVITESVPSPRELLQLQISGQRIITLNENYTSWPTTRIDGRDILGFTLHDLIHADHFFGDPVFRDGQLGFFRFVESLLSDKDLNFLLGSSEKFSKGFEYVISDMNSHPLHMFQTLHALLFSELGDDSRASLIWNRWCGGSACLLAVNTIAFSLVDALAVEAYSKKMGSSGELPTNNLQFDTL